MTTPTGTALTGHCGTCGGRIIHLGGPSWRHIGRIRDTGRTNHPADPDQATREQAELLAAAAH